jgi:hypothetical protein
LAAGGATWFLGAQVLQQSQEFIGAASEWPDRLEEKGKKHLPSETWDAVAGQFQAFKDYWQDMLGEDSNAGKLVLQPSEKETYNSLSSEERDTFHDLELMEREEFFALKSTESQSAYLLQKSLERKNQSMEMIEKQSGQIAVKSA